VVGLGRVELPIRGLGNHCTIQILARSDSPWRCRFALSFLAMEMFGPVTTRAKRDQVFFGIISELAARAEVVNLQIARCAAILAAPSIARQHVTGQTAIRVGFEASAAASVRTASTLALTVSSNCSRCATGRTSISRARAKNNISSEPGPRLALFRKSAQVVSTRGNWVPDDLLDLLHATAIGYCSPNSSNTVVIKHPVLAN
jgi:hypothetical protein